MKKVELLAPAGNYKTFIVAIEAGADAVYISGKNFGARSFAENFSLEELKEAVEFAHIRLKKVYVTVNTIVYQNEFEQLGEYIDYLDKIKVDAIIVQDLGIINFVRSNYPNLEVHASTQMNIFNENGLNILKRLGVKRVVLAREVSISQINSFKKRNIELEVFIHGALCFCASGNCLMSYSIGGRSGNRGTCAQPCRKKYSLIENNSVLKNDTSLLSTKDLCTIDNIPSLIDANIDSLKIEGRMKSPEYVYEVVSSYRRAIDAYYENKKIDNSSNILKIASIFNREFTDGYLFESSNYNITNTNSVNHQGIRIGKVVNCSKNYIEVLLEYPLYLQDALRIKSKNEIGLVVTNMFVNGDKISFAKPNETVKIPYSGDSITKNSLVFLTKPFSITKEITEMLRSERVKNPVAGVLNIKHSEKISLKLIIDDICVKAYGDTVTEIAKNPKSNEFYYDAISKLGDTPFYLKNLEINYDKISFVSMKMLNDLRKSAIQLLYNALISKDKNLSQDKLMPCHVYDNIDTGIEVVVNSKEQYEACKKYNIKTVYTDYESNLMNINQLDNRTYSNHMISNISQINGEFVASPYFNAINSDSVNLLSTLGASKIYLSYETNVDTIGQIIMNSINKNIGLPVYGKINVMVTKHCMISKSKGFVNKHCHSCDNNNYSLEDEFGNKFNILCDRKDCNLRILDYKTKDEYNKLEEIYNQGIRLFLLVFTTEDYKKTCEILSKYTNFVSKKII